MRSFYHKNEHALNFFYSVLTALQLGHGAVLRLGARPPPAKQVGRGEGVEEGAEDAVLVLHHLHAAVAAGRAPSPSTSAAKTTSTSAWRAARRRTCE